MMHEGAEGVVRAAAFSLDGRYLATGAEDGAVRLWMLRPEEMIAEACRRIGRSLTRKEWHRYLGEEPYRATCAPS